MEESLLTYIDFEMVQSESVSSGDQIETQGWWVCLADVCILKTWGTGRRDRWGRVGGVRRTGDLWPLAVVDWAWTTRQLQAKVRKRLPGSLCLFQTD